jgi:hypothetical protein
MELRRLKLLVVIWFFLLVALPALVLADPNIATWDDARLIATTMREYQARRVYIYGPNYPLSWPSSGGCPYYNALAYPSDEYYQNMIWSNPNAAVGLVCDIVEKFYDWMPIRPGRLYGKFPSEPSRWFVKSSCWQPYGTYLEPEPYDRFDFPGIPFYCFLINQSNYRNVLETIYRTLIEKFKVVTVFGDATDCELKQAYGNAEKEEDENCNDAVQDANSNWEAANWEPYPYGNPEVKEKTGKNILETQYLVEMIAARCKLGSDLRKDTGDANSWIRIEHPSEFECRPEIDDPNNICWSNLSGMEDVNTWQTSPIDGPDVGEFWKSDNYLGDVDKVHITTSCPNYPGKKHGWELIDVLIYVYPIFDANASVLADNTPDLDIYKNKDPKEGYIVYSANPDCCPVVSSGETVDGDVMPGYRADEAVVKLTKKYSTEAATLCVYGWSGEEDKKTIGWNLTGDELTDPNEVICYSDVNSLLFSVKGLQGETEVSFQVTFWRYDAPNYYKSQKEVTLKVKPYKDHDCCRERSSCGIMTIKARNAGRGVFCLYSDTADVWVHDNNDVEVRLPDRQTESYIMPPGSPPVWFLKGWHVERYGADVNVIYSNWKWPWDSRQGVIYEFRSSSPYKLTSITDLEGSPLVTFQYDTYDRLIKQKDAADPNYYIAYDYNDLSDYNDSPETITTQAYDVNRVYTIEYDDQGRIVAMASASCDCGGMGAIRYVFNDDDLVKEKRSYDTNEVIYEYVYDSDKRRVETWLGHKSDGNCVEKVFYTEYGDGLIVDTYDYVDPNTYRVIREYKNSAGLVTKRVHYNSLNEDPGDPAGDYFTEHIVYEYDANGLIEAKTVIPPSAGLSNPPAPPSGVRKEYTYDVNTGRLLAEKWFNANDANFTVTSYTYEQTPDGKHVRTKYSTDARGAQTEYFYDGNDLIPNTRIMPQVSTGISGTQRLKYEYTYDSQNRVILEKQLNDSNGILLQTKYVYDDGGNLIERCDDYGDSNEVTEYEYNGFNEMVMMTLPSGVINGWS